MYSKKLELESSDVRARRRWFAFLVFSSIFYIRFDNALSTFILHYFTRGSSRRRVWGSRTSFENISSKDLLFGESEWKRIKKKPLGFQKTFYWQFRSRISSSKGSSKELREKSWGLASCGQQFDADQISVASKFKTLSRSNCFFSWTDLRKRPRILELSSFLNPVGQKQSKLSNFVRVLTSRSNRVFDQWEKCFWIKIQ